MKGKILYYSGSGNTKISCEYIAQNLEGVEIELIDMVKNETIPDFDECDIVGFATFTDFFATPHLFEQYVRKIPEQNDKMAFVFNTYGIMSGQTLFRMSKEVTSRGFKVIAGHSFKTPESYPPAIKRGIGSQDNPKEKSLKKFKRFVEQLSDSLKSNAEGNEIKKAKIKKGSIMGRLFGNRGPTSARKSMGEKYVDEELCTECGVCEKGCPYNAIALSSKPEFDMEKCYGCWWCYNHCPKEAIYTNKMRGSSHYPKPTKEFKEKLMNL